MKKTSIASKLAGKKRVLVPLALSPVGVLLFVAVQSNQVEQPPEDRQPQSTSTPTQQSQPVTATSPTKKTTSTANTAEAVASDLDTNNRKVFARPETPTALSVSTAGNNQLDVQQTTWENDTYDDNNVLLSSFAVEIEQISDDKIEGNYCYISNYGNKIDCPNPFSGTAINPNDNTQYLVNFHSSFDNLAGQATIAFNNTELVWNLKKFPSDRGVAMPKHATLTKSSSTENQ